MAKSKDTSKKTSPQSLSNIIKEYNAARLGMDMDSSAGQIAKGKLSYALNAVVENFDDNSINYQNEPGNIHCLEFPEDFVLIGKHFINEQSKHIFFLTNPITGDSQMGYMLNNDCEYRVIIDDPCLGFSINHPIHKVVHKISNCTTELYWADNVARRYLDLEDLPFKVSGGAVGCGVEYTNKIDCNRLKVQPNFKIPGLAITNVTNGGQLTSGTYQFAIQYSDAIGSPLTSYYSVTNPCPLFNPATVTKDFNTPVGKAIEVSIDNLDTTGQFTYFNLAVIRTINGISSAQLIGTYSITGQLRTVTYTGANKTLTDLAFQEIFEKFPYYDIADDLTAARDVLVWKGLTSVDRVNYQEIASKIRLEWETYRIPEGEDYSDELNATNLRGYLRDEIYAFEIVLMLTNGKQTDGFHIPGREITLNETLFDDIPDTHPDFIGTPSSFESGTGTSPYWKIYNTALLLGQSPEYQTDPDYKGPFEYGIMGYHESTEEYPCNEDVWGELAGKKIRHHRFPDVAIAPIDESTGFTDSSSMVMKDNAKFALGVRLDLVQVKEIIKTSKLTQEQKDEIVGFKIIRGDRATNKSIVGKGILRNVSKYTRDEQEYFYPNYPYNDLTPDPFLNQENNAYEDECESFNIEVTVLSEDAQVRVEYNNCNNNKLTTEVYTSQGNYKLCSLGFPKVIEGSAVVTIDRYDLWRADSQGALCSGYDIEYTDLSKEIQQMRVAGSGNTNENEHRTNRVKVYPGTIIDITDGSSNCGIILEKIDEVNYENTCTIEAPVETDTADGRKLVFNSPETSFGQPFLGTALKLESVIFGGGKAHFVEVKNNAKYKLLSLEAQQDAAEEAERIAKITDPFGAQSFMQAYDLYLQLYIAGLSRRNFAKSFNSIASYNYNVPVRDNLGIKQRNIDTTKYLIPTVQSIGEGGSINNYNRETSVFIQTDEEKSELPFPHLSPDMTSLGVSDHSRHTISDVGNCDKPEKEEDISVVSYYASMKDPIDNQWGQIYSYSTVDTGYQVNLEEFGPTRAIIFGGDTFINKFAFKTKLPFFIDNRVGAPNDSDIFYDEIGNVAYPKYWHSSRSITEDANLPDMGVLANFYSYKAHKFDCPNDQFVEDGVPKDSNPNRLFYDGSFYMFAYGVPSFYCESSYNVDLRQAFNNREGEFWPHVTTGIPDDWVQEDFVSIAFDNTYYYNTSFSKQSRENEFTNLPPDWSEDECYTHYPFRAIYSDVQNTDADSRVNNWLIYRAVSYFDFPQNYGDFVAIDGIENKAVLARFENKTLLYNSLLTIDTSNPQAAYIGNDKLFSSAPPIDFSDTDLGFIGTQNKFLLKIPNGQVTVDTKRGQIFLLKGSSFDVISKFGTGVNSFMKEHLPYKILKYFPEAEVDNHFTGIGLHGVYDNRYDRIIITKLDYVPISDDILYDTETKEFYVYTIPGNKFSREVVYLNDPVYFANKSWSISFNLNTSSWVSFHSYIPNYYIAENNFFYSGINNCCDEFDFMVGELVPDPTTTTTTTIKEIICTPFMGTAVERELPGCDMTGEATRYEQCTMTGTAILQSDCILEGNGQIITP